MKYVLGCYFCEQEISGGNREGWWFHPDLKDVECYVKSCERCANEVGGKWVNDDEDDEE